MIDDPETVRPFVPARLVAKTAPAALMPSVLPLVTLPPVKLPPPVVVIDNVLAVLTVPPNKIAASLVSPVMMVCAAFTVPSTRALTAPSVSVDAAVPSRVPTSDCCAKPPWRMLVAAKLMLPPVASSLRLLPATATSPPLLARRVSKPVPVIEPALAVISTAPPAAWTIAEPSPRTTDFAAIR